MIASLALAALVTIGASTAEAGSTLCGAVPSLCANPSPPSNGGGNSGGHSVPEPGTLGLLAVGAAAGWARLRKRLKK
jgi:hypothetical protein